VVYIAADRLNVLRGASDSDVALGEPAATIGA
jgi:hypothetical protein